MTSPHEVTDLLLERYALGEVSPDERQTIEAELKRSPETCARLDAIEDSNQEILARYPVAKIVDDIRTRAGPPRSVWAPRLVVAVPALAMAAGLFVALMPAEEPTAVLSSDVEITRAKGLRPTLFVHRQTNGGSEKLGDGAAAAAHDLLQLSYVAAGRDRGAILSIDGRGTVTLHHPAKPDGDTTLLPAGEAALPHAYELDDAPTFERFFFVTAPIDTRSSLDAAAIVEAAERLARDLDRARAAPLALPNGYEQTSVWVAKSERMDP
jgi:hypothetical protein